MAPGRTEDDETGHAAVRDGPRVAGPPVKHLGGVVYIGRAGVNTNLAAGQDDQGQRHGRLLSRDGRWASLHCVYDERPVSEVARLVVPDP